MTLHFSSFFTRFLRVDGEKFLELWHVYIIFFPVAFILKVILAEYKILILVHLPPCPISELYYILWHKVLLLMLDFLTLKWLYLFLGCWNNYFLKKWSRVLPNYVLVIAILGQFSQVQGVVSYLSISDKFSWIIVFTMHPVRCLWFYTLGISDICMLDVPYPSSLPVNFPQVLFIFYFCFI